MRERAKRAPARGGGDDGFTLLEVMVAVAVLAVTLGVLLDIITNNVRATTHSRMTTTATFLARGRMVAMEDDIIDKGFQDKDDVQTGNFGAQGFPEFTWESAVEKIQLPTDMAQKTQQVAGAESQKRDPMQALTGMVGGIMGTFIEPVRVGLEESVRRVTLRVFWRERGRPEQSVEVTMYMTDPARLDIALALGAAAAGGTGAPGPGAQGGAKPGQPGVQAPGGMR